MDRQKTVPAFDRKRFGTILDKEADNRSRLWTAKRSIEEGMAVNGSAKQIRVFRYEQAQKLGHRTFRE
jgi:hypothetical protein